MRAISVGAHRCSQPKIDVADHRRPELDGRAAKEMSLASGTRVGPYEILSPLGAGGMGEVYRARDTKLKRDVAVKREAELLATLNHPNIAAIYGLEESDGVQALVLELVEGPTLADHIEHGVIPLDEALPTCRRLPR
jgi:serine/threonine protein kinase